MPRLELTQYSLGNQSTPVVHKIQCVGKIMHEKPPTAHTRWQTFQYHLIIAVLTSTCVLLGKPQQCAFTEAFCQSNHECSQEFITVSAAL